MIDFVAIGSIIIDDIIDPQGRSNMGALGGGGTHAVTGMRIWREAVALVAIIGQNFPESAWISLTSRTDLGYPFVTALTMASPSWWREETYFGNRALS